MTIDLDTIGKFVAFGYTFSTHIDDPNKDPAFWLQPRSSIVPQDEPIVLPRGIDAAHIGIEPTLLVTEDLWRATPAEVEDAVGGVTVSIDVSVPSALPARDADEPSPSFTLHPPAQIYKFAPGFRPVLTEPVSLGVSALSDRRVEGIVDGETVTIGSTDDLRFDPLALVAEVTRYVPLEPGDLVALGEGESPVVHAPCEVVGHIDGVGELSTSVVTV